MVGKNDSPIKRKPKIGKGIYRNMYVLLTGQLGGIEMIGTRVLVFLTPVVSTVSCWICTIGCETGIEAMSSLSE